MRIHDINVEVDPNKHAPAGPDPVEADGTQEGSVSQSHKNAIDFQLEDTTQYSSTYWTGPWPLLHVVVSWQVIANVIVLLHMTIDLLLQISVSQDGTYSVFTPLLEHHGYTGESAITEVDNSVRRANWFFWGVGNIWDGVDNAAVAVYLASFLSGLHPIGTAIWMIALGYWIFTILQALAFTYEQVVNEELSLLDASLFIMQKGLQYMVVGCVDLGQGIVLNMLLLESALYAAALAAGRVAWSFVDDIIVGFVVSGIIQILIGFAIVIYGALLGFGIIPV